MKYHTSNRTLGSKYKFNNGIYFIKKNYFIKDNHNGLGHLSHAENLSGGEKFWPFYLKNRPKHENEQHIYVSII